MPEQRINAELRQQVTERADGSCEYCRSQARYATQPFSIEHIIPRAKGGPTSYLPTLRSNSQLNCSAVVGWSAQYGQRRRFG
jgi:5-methylcytosine-specific restriction endonuclease McrA